MAIYIDPPVWQAHGTLWSHLYSDQSYDELHEFAARLPLPRRGFDLDHYDIPASRYEQAIEFGAIPVGIRDVVRLLGNSGLRVRPAEREAMRPIRRLEFLVQHWQQLAEPLGIDGSGESVHQWAVLGHELLGRWNEPHRRYHDEKHLEDVLLALNHLTIFGEHPDAITQTAAWFHDAIYQGNPSDDEQQSAEYAVRSLETLGLSGKQVQAVGELIVATTPNTTHHEISAQLAHLLDADLAILGAGEQRYREYTVAVRAEYAHVPEGQFREGRASILSHYLAQPSIYQTPAGQQLWEQRARVNLAQEITALREPKGERDS